MTREPDRRRIVIARHSHENGVYVLGIADRPDASGWHLVFAAADEYDDQDVELGEATYSISNDVGATLYGGLEACELSDGELRLRFTRKTAEILDLPVDCRLALGLSDEDKATLLNGLTRLGLYQPPTSR